MQQRSALDGCECCDRSPHAQHKAWLKEEGDADLLPFDDDVPMLEEGLCAEDFPRDVPGHRQPKGDGGVASWWPAAPSSRSAAVLISGVGARRSRSAQLAPLAEEEDAADAWPPPDLALPPPLASVGRGNSGIGLLRTQRSMPMPAMLPMRGAGDLGGMSSLPRSMTMPPPTVGDCNLDALMCELGAGAEAISMDPPLSTGLEPIDMHLPGLADLGSDGMPSMLLDAASPVALQSGAAASSLGGSSSVQPLVGGSGHGSMEFESHLSGLVNASACDFLPGAPPADVADVAQFLCVDATEEDAQMKDLALAEASSSLTSARGSARSLVSDSTAVQLSPPTSQLLQPGSPLMASASISNTPEVSRSPNQ